MLSRRGFLIGAGGLLTAAFVKDARSFVLRNEQPLLVPPPQVAQTLFWYDNGEQGLMLTVGNGTVCPPPPTWREFFVSEGIPHRRSSDAEHLFAQHGIEPADYDEPGRRVLVGDQVRPRDRPDCQGVQLAEEARPWP